jgi:hypothetical protein
MELDEQFIYDWLGCHTMINTYVFLVYFNGVCNASLETIKKNKRSW